MWLHLHTPAMLVLYAQAWLLMGGLATIHTYLTFLLEATPLRLNTTVTPLLFLAI
jgi:hypothetical protein